MNQFSLDFEKWAGSERVLSPLLLTIAHAISSISSIHDTLLANPLEYVVLQVKWFDQLLLFEHRTASTCTTIVLCVCVCVPNYSRSGSICYIRRV